MNLYGCGIDGEGQQRYSQAQIPDLVANANPRFRQAAQGFGPATPCADCFPTQPIAAAHSGTEGARHHGSKSTSTHCSGGRKKP